MTFPLLDSVTTLPKKTFCFKHVGTAGQKDAYIWLISSVHPVFLYLRIVTVYLTSKFLAEFNISICLIMLHIFIISPCILIH